MWQAHTNTSTLRFSNKTTIDTIHFQPEIQLLQGCTVSKCSVIRWHCEELLLMHNTILLLFSLKINASMPQQTSHQHSYHRQSPRLRNGKLVKVNFFHFNKSQVGFRCINQFAYEANLVRASHMLGASLQAGDIAVTMTTSCPHGVFILLKW